MAKKNKNTKLKHLEETLDLLIRDPNITNLFGSMHKSFTNLKDKISIPKKECHIEFDPIIFDVYNENDKDTYEDRKTKILIGGKLIFINGNLVYQSLQLSLVVNEILNNNNLESSKEINADSCCLVKYGKEDFFRVIRKFHFDFQPKDYANVEKQRTNIIETHIQYGGKFKCELNNYKFHYCLDHWLEKPRLYFPPIDLVLLLEFIKNEFNTNFSVIQQNRKWKGLVKKSEQLYWEDYYRKLINCANSKFTMNDVIFGQNK